MAIKMKKVIKKLKESNIEATEEEILKVAEEIGEDAYITSQYGVDYYKIIQQFTIEKYNEKIKLMGEEVIDYIFVKNGFGNIATMQYSSGSICYYIMYLTKETLEVYPLGIKYKELDHYSYKIKDIIGIELGGESGIIGQIMSNPYVIELKGKKLRLKSIGISMNIDIEEFLRKIKELKRLEK